MSLRFFAGGGQPPQSHEVLLVEADGSGWYLTGLPWPEQPPFDEIGRYRVELGADGRQVTLVRDPITFGDADLRYELPPPELGEHSDEIKAWLRTHLDSGTAG